MAVVGVAAAGELGAPPATGRAEPRPQGHATAAAAGPPRLVQHSRALPRTPDPTCPPHSFSCSPPHFSTKLQPGAKGQALGGGSTAPTAPSAPERECWQGQGGLSPPQCTAQSCPSLQPLPSSGCGPTTSTVGRRGQRVPTCSTPSSCFGALNLTKVPPPHTRGAPSLCLPPIGAQAPGVSSSGEDSCAAGGSGLSPTP